ncbi:MAG: hypothetical protein K2M07_00025 [Muribaculaceae bacterium]|nr:hypothetical protein [Muribaculaceae bacterium]
MKRHFHFCSKFLPVLSIIFISFLYACDSEESAIISRAEKEGAQAAHELIEDMPLSEIDMQNRLLTIMSNEYELRKDGHSKAADAYIDSFITVLSSESDSLTNVIGYEKTTH